jgi:hypothetical protein
MVMTLYGGFATDPVTGLICMALIGAGTVLGLAWMVFGRKG